MKYIEYLVSPFAIVILVAINMIGLLVLPVAFYSILMLGIVLYIMNLIVSYLLSTVFFAKLFQFIINNPSYMEECKNKNIMQYISHYFIWKDPMQIYSEDFNKSYLTWSKGKMNGSSKEKKNKNKK
ncbi:MAG: hypothetical protein COA52_01410 [Hyphomicrobiales bacterium]|nr:MAG: hypothetical protein COA52_00320 [Hyphomicrobiales bacterium]PCJ96889.1 MAG: hypothetical protein COA52_01410 [Hyphomicrobiales bacterium]